jgi:hypothetical protein
LSPLSPDEAQHLVGLLSKLVAGHELEVPWICSDRLLLDC